MERRKKHGYVFISVFHVTITNVGVIKQHSSVRLFAPGWMVERLASPFRTKIGYIRDKVLGGDLVLPD